MYVLMSAQECLVESWGELGQFAKKNNEFRPLYFGTHMLERELNAGIGKLVPLSRLINRRESAFHFEIQTNQWIPSIDSIPEERTECEHEVQTKAIRSEIRFKRLSSGLG